VFGSAIGELSGEYVILGRRVRLRVEGEGKIGVNCSRALALSPPLPLRNDVGCLDSGRSISGGSIFER